MIHDIMINNGRIVDGTGNPWYNGDLALFQGKIQAFGNLGEVGAKRSIDANRLVVAPGFIDAHSHSDTTTLVYRQMESTLMQGITTVVSGHCGGSLAPINPEMQEYIEKRFSTWLPPEVELKIIWSTFDEYLKEEEKEGLGANVAHLVGHSTVRTAAMGMYDRDPTPAELKAMKKLVEEAMEAGAYGLSTGLIYPPGIYAKTDEIIELAKVVAKYGGVYDSHIRGEAKTLLAAVEEAIAIGERAGVSVQISHHKASGTENWGKSVETLRMIEAARERGIDVTVDQYPYRAGATVLSILLPPWAHDGGSEKLLERLQDSALREKMRDDIEMGLPDWENLAVSGGWENVYVTYVMTEANKIVEGKNLLEIMELRGDPDVFTTLFDLLLEEEASPDMVIFEMHEDDIQRIMQHPLQMVSTDAGSGTITGPFSKGKPHPRRYGTYPRILGKYVREKHVLRLEEAIRKMTSFPAQKFGLLDRGVLRSGMNADITIFDPKTVIDKATYQDPHQFPEGIQHVIVNGQIVVEKGKYTGELAGKTLRKTQAISPLNHRK
ncbi:MAG: amidohydrolase family protein [Candidatus Heimdallarchaeota archaeon]